LPDGPSPLVIGVSGGDEDFLNVLAGVIAGKMVGPHVLAVKPVNSADDLKSCQMVFFRASEKKRTAAALQALTQTGILLVGEDESFLREGGMISLVRDHGSVRFEVNPDALDRSEIHFGAKMLALAKASYGAPRATASSSPVAPTTRRLESGTPPEYPDLARRMNLTGAVQLEALVKPDGTVREVHVLGGHPLLADALARAVKQWKYQPASRETTEIVKFSFAP
jgi:TonB family protein